MAEERTNTTRMSEDLEDGVYELTVMGKPEKRATAKSHFRLWKFGTVVEGRPKKVTILLYPWESEELLMALGAKKDGKDTVWDPDKVDKKKVKAEIIHELCSDNVSRIKIKRAKALKASSKDEEEPEESSKEKADDESEVPF